MVNFTRGSIATARCPVDQPTLSSDWLRDGTRVTQAVGIDGSDDEQVDGVGLKAADCVSFYLDHVSYSLPRAAG